MAEVKEQDKPEVAPANDKAPDAKEQPESSNSSDKADEKFLLDFTSKEEAEKAFKEAHAKITQLTQKESEELAALKAKLEVIESQENEKKIIADREKLMSEDEELMKLLAEDPGQALKLIRGASLDVLDITEKKYRDLEQKVEERLLKQSSAYVENKKEIEDVVKEYDLPLSKAIDLVTKMKGVSQPERPEVGNNLKGGPDDEEELPEVKLPADMQGFLKDSGLSDDDVKEIKENMRKEVARG